MDHDVHFDPTRIKELANLLASLQVTRQTGCTQRRRHIDDTGAQHARLERSSVVERRDHLPDLPALLCRQQRRRHRRSQRRTAPSRPLAEAGHRRRLAVANLPLADAGCRLRHQRLLRCRPAVRLAGRHRSPDQRGARTGHAPAAGFRAQPHLGPTPLVPRVAQRTRQSQTRLVRLARPAEQLARTAERRRRLDLGRGHPAVLPAPVPAAATGPELAQPRSGRGDARRIAFLAGSRRGWLSHRRHPLHRQRPELRRRSALPGRRTAGQLQRPALQPRGAARDTPGGRQLSRRTRVGG